MSKRGAYRSGAIATTVLLVEVFAWGIGLALWFSADRYLQQFRLERPEVLWALFAGPVLVALYLIGMGSKNRALHRFSDTELIPAMVPGISSWRSTLKFLLLRHGLSFAIFALAGPQMGTRLEEVKAEGVDVVVAMDVSNSMLAEDINPDRMEVAKRGLSRLIDRMKGDRLGIVVFAGEAFTQLPITADRSAAKLFLNSIGPKLVRSQGTAIGAAIRQAHNSFQKEGAKGKAIIVITDGESFEDDGEAAARSAAADGIIVSTIGIGSPEGAPIPMRQNGRMIGFKKDKQGQTVITKLNEEMLKRIANAGQGRYIRASATDMGLDTLIDDLRHMEQTEMGTHRFAGHEDRFQYFLAIACLLIIPGLLLGERSLSQKWKKFIPWHA